MSTPAAGASDRALAQRRCAAACRLIGRGRRAAALLVASSSLCAGGGEPAAPFAAFAGAYRMPDGVTLIVEASKDGLTIEEENGDLLRHADERADSRVLAVEARSHRLIEATRADDHDALIRLFGGTPGEMEPFLHRYLALAGPALRAHPPGHPVAIAATVYRDEDSDHGFEDEGWGWEVYVRCDAACGTDAILRLVWDGITGDLVHSGRGKTPPRAPRLEFEPRPPARSWVRAYNPLTRTTMRVREAAAAHRDVLVPARFVAYHAATHQTVSVRFRRATPDEPMAIEIGPLGSSDLLRGTRVEEPSPVTPVQDADALTDFSWARAQVSEAMEAERIPGVAVGIVVGDRLAYSEGFGVIATDSTTPATPRTLFQIGSVTKVFTASLLMVLHDRGELRLSDPVQAHLPAGLRMPTEPPHGDATLFHLATHISGLPRDAPNRRDIPDTPTVPEPSSRAELHEALRSTPLVAPPGSVGLYSSFGMDLLGAILDSTSTTSLEALLRERIWKPLGMTATFVHRRPSTGLDAAGHHWPADPKRAVQEPWQVGEVWGSHGVSSNVDDLARFLGWQFRAGTSADGPISGAALLLMHSPARPRARTITQSFGIGWLVDELAGPGRLIHHDGDTDGNSAFIGAFVESGIGVIVLANLGGVADEIGDALVEEIGERLSAETRSYRQAFETGDWQALERLAARKVRRNPWSSRALYFRGKALVKLGRCAEALPLLAKAAQIGIYRDYATYYQATCRVRAGQETEGLDLLARAFQMGFRDGDELAADPTWAAATDHPTVQRLLQHAH